MRRSATLAVALIATLAIPPRDSAAQGAPTPVAAGARVRVRYELPADAPPGEVGTAVGALVRVGPDSVVVRDGGRLVAVPRALLTQLALSEGRVSRGRAALRGAGIGLLAGAVTGAALGGLTYDSCKPGEWCIFTRGEAIVLGGAFLGAGGILVGGGIGALRGGERWRAVPVPEVAARPRLQVTPRGVMLSLRF